MNNPKSYHIGVIGAGWIARAHMGFLQESGRAGITWIAARNPENLEQVRRSFHVPNKTRDYRDILKDPGVDVVLIATPPDTHREMFVEALKAGKHVLLEKPMALNREELEEMMRVKAQYPELIAMDCSGRHSRLNPKFTLVKELIASGALGDIYHIHHQSVSRQRRPGIEFHPVAKWFLDKSRAGGGPLYDWGVYDLSFHLGVLDDRSQLETVERVVLKSGLDQVDPETEVYDVEEHLLVNMQLSGGISYYWERGVHAHMLVPNETRIYGTRGGLKLAYCTWDDPEVIYYDLDETGKARETRYSSACPEREDGYYLTRHLIDVLDGKAQPLVPLETAKKHMEIIFKINESN
ncbi:MAG: Gfo/Idh/MocA family oxidoreductase [Bacteroidales bacterium]|nr:Gfo/Idh/MocA family oxidoreductase [Bacteroidales bacterium]